MARYIPQTQRIMKGIRSLGEMPMRFRLYDKEPWHSAGLRFFPVDNYLIFYLPDESENKVSIVRIMYGGRDIGSIPDSMATAIPFHAGISPHNLYQQVKLRTYR